MIPTEEEMTDALKKRNGAELQDKFSAATVAVCGLGGLGSNISISLARTGIGKLILIDFDRVDITNLNRQQYKANQIGRYKTDALKENLKEIAPYIELESHTAYIDEGNAIDLLKDADIICEAFDNAEMGSANSIKTRKLTDRFYLCGDGVSDINDNKGLVAPRVMLCAAHQAHTVLRIIANKEDSEKNFA